jgi:hypothetical protein
VKPRHPTYCEAACAGPISYGLLPARFCMFNISCIPTPFLKYDDAKMTKSLLKIHWNRYNHVSNVFNVRWQWFYSLLNMLIWIIANDLQVVYLVWNNISPKSALFENNSWDASCSFVSEHVTW